MLSTNGSIRISDMCSCLGGSSGGYGAPQQQQQQGGGGKSTLTLNVPVGELR